MIKTKWLYIYISNLPCDELTDEFQKRNLKLQPIKTLEPFNMQLTVTASNDKKFLPVVIVLLQTPLVQTKRAL